MITAPAWQKARHLALQIDLWVRIAPPITTPVLSIGEDVDDVRYEPTSERYHMHVHLDGMPGTVEVSAVELRPEFLWDDPPQVDYAAWLSEAPDRAEARGILERLARYSLAGASALVRFDALVAALPRAEPTTGG